MTFQRQQVPIGTYRARLRHSGSMLKAEDLDGSLALVDAMVGRSGTFHGRA